MSFKGPNSLGTKGSLKTAIRISVANMAEKSPTGLREILWQDEWVQDALNALHRRLKNAERDAVRLYFEAVELVGTRQESAVLTLFGSLGVQSVAELRAMIAIAQGAQGVTLDIARDRAVGLLRRLIATDPSQRDRLKAELFGEYEIQGGSHAELAETNGDSYEPGANGHG